MTLTIMTLTLQRPKLPPLHESAVQEAHQAKQITVEGETKPSLSPAKQSTEGASGGEATAKQAVSPSASEQGSED